MLYAWCHQYDPGVDAGTAVSRSKYVARCTMIDPFIALLDGTQRHFEGLPFASYRGWLKAYIYFVVRGFYINPWRGAKPWARVRIVGAPLKMEWKVFGMLVSHTVHFSDRFFTHPKHPRGAAILLCPRCRGSLSLPPLVLMGERLQVC